MTGLEALAIGLAVAGAGAQVVSGMQAGAAHERQAEYAEVAAEQRRQAAEYEAERVRREGERHLSRVRAQYGASGVASTGSPMQVLESEAGEIELDRLAELYRGEVGAYGMRAEAGMQRQQARQARIGGYTRAATTLASTGLRVAGSRTS